MDYKTLLSKGGIYSAYYELNYEYNKVVASLEFRDAEIKELKAWQAGHKGSVERQSAEFWEQKYWANVKRFGELNLEQYGRIETSLPKSVTVKSIGEIANFLLDHYYKVLPRRDKYIDTSFAAHVMYAAELLRKYAMVKKTKDPISEQMEEVTGKEEVTPVPKLSVITGGRGGEGNWLSKLKPGCIFLAKKKGDHEYLCYQFLLDWKGKRGALLSSNVPVKAEVPVDMQAFSLGHELVEIQKEGYELE